MIASASDLRAMRLALALVVLASLPTRARAEERAIELFMPHYGYDVGYVAVAGSVYFTARYAITPRDHGAAPLDGRGAHAFHHAPDVASDVTLGLVMYATPLAAYLLDGTRDGDYVRALRVPIVLLESFAMTSAIVAMIKNAGVCRPYAYQPGSGCGDGVGVPDGYEEQRRSFPSGHASSTASVGGALLGMWLLPTGRDDRLAPLALGATALSIATASLRVRAGAHSLVDVGVGFGIGIGVGLGTAALHLRVPASRVEIAPTTNGLSVSGRF